MVNRRSHAAPGGNDSTSLTTGEKVQIWITTLINPIIAGAIYYYGWKKLLPVKAKQANKISWIAFAIVIIIAIALGVLSLLANGSVPTPQ
jgi:uncharacterized membrane protein YedE/YeeE